MRGWVECRRVRPPAPVVADSVRGVALMAGILITVGVMLDTMKQVESHLQMHNYDGFMQSGH